MFDRVGLLSNEPPRHSRVALYLVIRSSRRDILPRRETKSTRPFFHAGKLIGILITGVSKPVCGSSLVTTSVPFGPPPSEWRNASPDCARSPRILLRDRPGGNSSPVSTSGCRRSGTATPAENRSRPPTRTERKLLVDCLERLKPLGIRLIVAPVRNSWRQICGSSRSRPS